MDYFISIENTQYMRWQTALLLESLRPFGLEENLVIAVCPGKGSKKVSYSRMFEHENVGVKAGYRPLNKPFALIQALENGILKPPFTVIDPDMVMTRPVPASSAPFSAQHVWYMSYQHVTEVEGHTLQEWGVQPEKWPTVGCVYQFNEAPLALFKSIFDYNVKLLEPHRKYNTRTGYWQREMIAFSLGLSAYPVEILTHYQMPLCTKFFSENPKWDSCFIHYCNGMPPWFVKQCHDGNRPFSLSSPLPFETILSIPAYKKPGTELIPFFQKIVRSFVSRCDGDI